MQILNYSDFIEETDEMQGELNDSIFDLSGGFSPRFNYRHPFMLSKIEQNWNKIYYDDSLLINQKITSNIFDSRDGACIFCNKEMDLIRKSYEEYQKEDFSWEVDYSISSFFCCQFCGWWQNSIYDVITDDSKISLQRTRKIAILKEFDSSSKELPLAILNEEIRKNPSVLFTVNSKKMEEFVRSVLMSFFNCEVKHVGKTGDGGIDLILVESDSSIAVQVKRRTKEDSVEKVSMVREFLGSLIDNDYRKGLYVTTANKFSEASLQFQKRQITNRRLEMFELIDFDRLLKIFNLTSKPDPYKEFIESWVLGKKIDIKEMRRRFS